MLRFLSCHRENKEAGLIFCELQNLGLVEKQTHFPLTALRGHPLLKVFVTPDEAAAWDHSSSLPLLC